MFAGQLISNPSNNFTSQCANPDESKYTIFLTFCRRELGGGGGTLRKTLYPPQKIERQQKQQHFVFKQ